MHASRQKGLLIYSEHMRLLAELRGRIMLLILRFSESGVSSMLFDKFRDTVLGSVEADNLPLPRMTQHG